MGSWGYEPFQSDAALDWVDGIEKGLDKAFKVSCETIEQTDCEHELMAATQVIISFAPLGYYDEDIVERAKERLNSLLTSGWINTWREPELMVKSLNRILGDLDTIKHSHLKGLMETVLAYERATRS